MVLTNHMKLLLHEGYGRKIHRHQQKDKKGHKIPKTEESLIEESKQQKANHDWTFDPHANRRKRFIDPTKDQLDSFCNLDVGTKLRHLHFGDRHFGTHERRVTNFTQVVDLDVADYRKIILNRFLRDVLASYIFRWAILGLVIINALVIGLNTSEYYSEEWRMPFDIIDQIILSVFVFEVMLKWMYDFRAFWIVKWNILDFLILAMIALASLLPIFIQSRAALAVIRVVRALRSLRSVSNLTSLIVVSHTITKSTVDMANILFVLIIFMIVMSIAGVVLFDDASFQTTRFLSSFDAWFVLFICVTQDGWIEVLDSFRNAKGGGFILISIYLIIGVSIGAFVFANLIVAVVVANLESAIRSLKAEKTKNENPLIQHDEFSPNAIEIIPTYGPFRTARIPILHQRPLLAPKITNPSKRRLRVYQLAIVALEQNLLEYSTIEQDFVQVLSVILGILEQMERHEQTVEENAAKRKQALKDLQVYSNLGIPGDAFDRMDLHSSFMDLKGGSSNLTSLR